MLPAGIVNNVMSQNNIIFSVPVYELYAWFTLLLTGSYTKWLTNANGDCMTASIKFVLGFHTEMKVNVAYLP